LIGTAQPSGMKHRVMPVWFLLMVATPNASLASEPEHGEVEARNIVSIGPQIAFHDLRQREATDRGAPEGDLLGGVLLVYERVLVPRAWALVVAKPFLFGPGRFDSQFELAGKRLFSFGSWELFVSLGVSFSLRLFLDQRVALEGRDNELSLGLVARTGLVRHVSNRVLIGFELGYGWIPLSRVVEHEFAMSLLVGYAF
jgi:hypothetical protein